MTNLPARLSILDREISELSARLQPPSPDFVANSLDRLKAGGFAMPKGIKASEFLDEYREALANVPLCGLAVAVVKLKRGDYPLTSDYLPIPARLAQLARKEAMDVAEDRARAMEIKRTLQDSIAPEKDAVENERVKARIRDIYSAYVQSREAASAMQAQNMRANDPLDAESREYWRRVAALDDAPNPTAEQIAYRRKIAAEAMAEQPTEGYDYD